LARETYLEAFAAAIYAGRLSLPATAQQISEAARAAPPGPGLPRPIDLLVDGLAARFIDGCDAGVPLLGRALRAIVSEPGRNETDLRWLWLTSPIAFEAWDDEAWDRLTARAVKVARDSGALAVLRVALAYRAGVHIHAGDFAAGATLLEEADAISVATGLTPVGKYAWQVLAAWRGDEARVLKLIETDLADATARGEGRVIAVIGFATAMLYNGLGRYPEALSGARQACEHEDLGLFGWSLAELVEAGARCGAHEVALDALRRLEAPTLAAGTDWGLGMLARSRALVSDGDSADALYREAIERLQRSRVVVHLARAHLVYGEWLRRENRRVDARAQLRIAWEKLSGMGAAAFAERARRELLATGETVRKRAAGAHEVLTAQETQIARLAVGGRTNSEIGSQLFISSRTVEYHLHKVFTKLGVGSRRELRNMLPSGLA
jgi:DNA-binding CsgD family transcriptional regulator/tetratricopeptide (TPR) repeat protein